MANPSISVRKASDAVPLLYRILLLYFEPICALGGVAMVLLNPHKYAETMTRAAMPPFSDAADWVWTELAGGWLHFAFTEGVILRLLDDVRAWRLLCIGMLLSDLAYTHSVAQAVGGWNVWLDLRQWSADDWTVTITTWPFVLARLSIVLGVGLKR